MIGWDICIRIDRIEPATGSKQLKKLEVIIDKRLKGKGLSTLDSDSLFYLARFYKQAAIAISGTYTRKCVRMFRLASKRASEVSRDRIVRELAAFLDAVEFEKQAKESRRALEECMNADIGVVADAAIALAMSYDTVDDYERAVKPLAAAIEKYDIITQELRAELKTMQWYLKRTKRRK